MSLNLPSVIGHRGAAAHAPENTLAGFRVAKTLGCTWVEFDVRLTADGWPVVCHDDKLERTTGVRGRVSALPLADILRLDAGSWFAARFAGERIPTLDDVLTLCRELGLGANVELKAERDRGPATAAAVIDRLARLGGDAPSRILVSSFLPDAIAATAALAASLPRGMLWRKLPRSWRRIAARLGCATIHCRHTELTQDIAAEVCAEGYPLLVYTVNAPLRAQQLFAWGVASVFSDAPDIIGPAAVEPRRGVSL